jgi:hypothetical protein
MVCEDMDVDLTWLRRVEPSSPSALVERLTRIEALLEEHGQQLKDIALHSGVPRGPIGSSFQPHSLIFPPPHLALHSPSAAPAITPNRSQQENLDAHPDPAQFLIPYNHTASAMSLLSSGQLKSLVGDYPKEYLYSLEEDLPLPPPLGLLQNFSHDWPPLDAGTLDSLARCYFMAAHPHFPLFTVQDLEGWQADLLKNGFDGSAETAICLCVYALGCLVSTEGVDVSPEMQAEKDSVSLKFFYPAFRIILQETIWGFSPNMSTCQALILCSLYFAHMGRPLHSWKMAYFASLQFIQLLEEYVPKKFVFYLRFLFSPRPVPCTPHYHAQA